MYNSFYNFTPIAAMPLSPQDVENAIELYRSGATIPEIARLFGVTKQAISQRFKKLGIERPLPAPTPALAEIMDAFERQCLLDSAAERKRRLAEAWS
jgi:hypothetical protein